MAKRSKFFCIAVEGATCDGRTLDAGALQEMADSYDPKTYSARVNMEHIRGFSAEPPFNAYGDVVALETREVELQLGGKTEKKLGLFAQVDALDNLVAVQAKGQKLYSSIELNPNFASTGKAYLQGLAVTDSPASLGTEIMTFAAGQVEAGKTSPFADRKVERAISSPPRARSMRCSSKSMAARRRRRASSRTCAASSKPFRVSALRTTAKATIPRPRPRRRPPARRSPRTTISRRSSLQAWKSSPAAWKPRARH
ncbi:GPO family capsid scaffolding protein [Novosphingopyxis sp. YJ-S2-01]|uniref:GPO family capsid scaffolding protein n=1 Tax=Novosphingopyxis sp. YJ-S2-01 TaxID=2794021 RepID=UPI0018DCE226|nr:GPO family capsid scaffolding protein [Novosphingopyxis sp. YJ-S2-01]MBH9536940.1 GPO family capsid scaffolding protein [Novosphingopyxis sp. YJ-S2-01]